jgi:hypothetical protein
MTSFTHKNRGLDAARRGKSVKTGPARGQAGLAAAGLLAGATMLTLSTGCAQQHATPQEVVKFLAHRPHVKPEPPDAPVYVDGAMLARQWPQSDAQWSNAKLVGWPTRFPFNSDINSDRPFPNSRLEDTVLFLYQFFRLPFTYIKDRPFETVLFTSGVKYRPTFEAMPALPPLSESDIETAGQVSRPLTLPGYDVTGGPTAPGDVVAPATTPSTGPSTAPSGN